MANNPTTGRPVGNAADGSATRLATSESGLALGSSESLRPQLEELALDVRWAWNHAADEVWRQLDPELWELTHNPWGMLQTVSRDRVDQLASDQGFRAKVDMLLQDKRGASEAPAWFGQAYPQSALTRVGYFSMEFMLTEALSIYSGGLGNVAGDQLKAASDLGVPVIGVGLLYQQGYFRQLIDHTGAQQALFPYNDPGQMPISPVRKHNGEWLRLRLDFPGASVWLRAWQVQVGRARLYLLDSNDLANLPAQRGITSELYGGDPELRLQQEIVLGIGGWRLLRALDMQPEVCHLNEGHAALAVLERAASFMEDTGQPFEVARTVTRAGNLFTTHTAVAAGFDVFSPALVEHYLRPYAEQRLGITLVDLLALGRRDADDDREPFNMAYLATRGCGAVNGVSRLHGQVSRHVFAPLFPRWPEEEVPVGYVTNGVHMPSWDSARADDLWTNASGKSRWSGTLDTMEQDIRKVPDAELWQLRTAARAALIDFARARLVRDLTTSGAPPDAVDAARGLFAPETLTLGFARRFAPYKRPNLLLHDPDRLVRLLTSTEHPLQLVVAGKAHPADLGGQALIQAWTQFTREPAVRQHAIFLSDDDMLLTEQLVQGVDLWLNTPRRPWEACGTSGMKVLVNGGLNCSELDGWWAEAYAPEVGWALGDGREHGDDPAWDAAEAEALYTLLESQILPAFYTRDADGIPRGWLARMRESMARLTPTFSTNRVEREYVERHYVPGAAAFLRRAAHDCLLGKQIVDWRSTIDGHWAELEFGEARVETSEGRHTITVDVWLHDLDPASVRVELYAMGIDGSEPVRTEMTRIGTSADLSGGYVYQGCVSSSQPASDFSARAMPHHDGVTIPLEVNRIAWQR